jgi:hypothetical protein
MADAKNDHETGPPDADKSPALQSVIDALDRLKFGAIQLTVHEGKLVQVDVTERQRFSN